MKYKLPYGHFFRDKDFRKGSDYEMSSNGSCCSSKNCTRKDVDGLCSDCGQATEDGEATDCCSYSPLQCEKCGWRPCDGSC